eukprot:4180776-Pleurochrysis_carterae.AAC.1
MERPHRCPCKCGEGDTCARAHARTRTLTHKRWRRYEGAEAGEEESVAGTEKEMTRDSEVERNTGTTRQGHKWRERVGDGGGDIDGGRIGRCDKGAESLT